MGVSTQIDVCLLGVTVQGFLFLLVFFGGGLLYFYFLYSTIFVVVGMYAQKINSN